MTQPQEIVERLRFHVEGQTAQDRRFQIWDNVEGHYARFRNITDEGDASAICRMLNELHAKSEHQATLLEEALGALEQVAQKAHFADALELSDDDYVDAAPLQAGVYRAVRSFLAKLSNPPTVTEKV